MPSWNADRYLSAALKGGQSPKFSKRVYEANDKVNKVELAQNNAEKEDQIDYFKNIFKK